MSAASPGTTSPFRASYRDGEQWKTTQSFGFNDLLVLVKLADQTHRLIAERNAEAASAAGNDEGA